MTYILVNICENNVNGNRSGRCHKISFCFETEEFLCAECRFLEGVPIYTFNSQRPGHIQIYDHFVKYESVTNWAGNMMWNQYSVPVPAALGFINLLQRQRDFCVLSAYSDIARSWNCDQEITAADLGFSPEITPELINPAQLQIF